MSMTQTMPGLPDPQTHPDFYAGVPVKRGLAWLVDFSLIAILTAIAVPFTAFTGLFYLPALYLVIGFLYRWVTISNRSGTFGMRLMSIEFRNRFGESFDGSTALVHTAGYTISVTVFPLQLVSIALMLISERGQGLTDHILGTTAVNKAA